MTDESRVPVSLSLDAWLDRLSQRGGEPGGGAASGVMLAIGAALLHMVAAYTPDDERAQRSGQRAVELRVDALRAAEEDGVRSAALGAALAEDASPDRDARMTRHPRPWSGSVRRSPPSCACSRTAETRT
jgi:hypothetical protein